MRQKGRAFSQANFGLWSVVLLKRTVARQYHTARRQQDEFKRDERTTLIHGKASRRLGENFYRGAKRGLRKVSWLFERVYEPC